MLNKNIDGTWLIAVPKREEAATKHANVKSDDDEITIEKPVAGSVSTNVALVTIMSQLTTLTKLFKT